MLRDKTDNIVHLMNRMKMIILVLMFRFLLDLSYGNIVAVTFSSSGYEYSTRGIVGISFSYLFTIILAGLFSPDLGSVSRIIVFYLFLFIYVPVSTLFAQNDTLNPVPYFLMTVCFLFLILGIRLKLPEFKESLVFRFKKGYAFCLSLVGGGIALGLLLAKFGIPTQLPSLSEVYEVRGLYKETVSRFLGYIIGWQGNVLNGFLFMTGILKRSTLLITGSLLFQLYLYSITGFKSLFFSFFLIIWLGIGVKLFSRHFAQYLVGTVCLSLFAVILSTMYAEEWILIPGIVLVRLYFVPALLTYYYYDFFSYHDIDWFAQNLPFNLFQKSNYETSIPYMIGDYYFGRAEMSANANLFADGYANLGIGGCLLVTLVLIVFLRGLDVLSSRKNPYLVLALIAMPMFSLTNSSLLTTFLTHGFLLAMVIIFLLSEDDGSR